MPAECNTVHKPGAENVAADFLSCYGCQVEETDEFISVEHRFADV